jgi:translation elongation factor EF-G
MITFFILYENYEYVNKVVTKINAECPNAMCIGITNKVNKKSIIFCKNEQPHVIIGSYASLETIKNDLNYEHISIPILSESIEFIKKISNQLKSLSQNCLYSHKLDLANYKKRIMNCLINLNFNPNLCGTRYILDCIVFSHENPYSCMNALTLKKYFKQLAIKYSSTESAISYSIRTAIEDMHESSPSNLRKHNFGSDDYITYLMIINRLKLL